MLKGEMCVSGPILLCICVPKEKAHPQLWNFLRKRTRLSHPNPTCC
jgi:hypothetical protein